jgi:hypothetical protein
LEVLEDFALGRKRFAQLSFELILLPYLVAGHTVHAATLPCAEILAQVRIFFLGGSFRTTLRMAGSVSPRLRRGCTECEYLLFGLWGSASIPLETAVLPQSLVSRDSPLEYLAFAYAVGHAA